MNKTLPPTAFVNALETLINCHSYENGSNTPDWILAEYMLNCLASFNGAVKQRDKWYGVHLKPGDTYFEKGTPCRLLPELQ